VILEAAEAGTHDLRLIWVDQGFSGPNFARAVKQLMGAEVEVIRRQSAGEAVSKEK
jgi:hypothetical protein